MRIGILGGTFNPIHNAHLYIAGGALKKLRLDKVIFIPAYIPPHKKIRDKVSAYDRHNMLRAALVGRKGFAVSTCEIKRKGRSYSIKTARRLMREYGKKTRLFFLIGADSLRGLKKWKDIAKLGKIVCFAVFPRSGFRIRRSSASIIRINIPAKDMSSSMIRRRVKQKKPIGRFVPRRVAEYIKKKRLYLK